MVTNGVRDVYFTHGALITVMKTAESQEVQRHPLKYEGLLKGAVMLTCDDQRDLAFLSSHDNFFANANPLP